MRLIRDEEKVGGGGGGGDGMEGGGGKLYTYRYTVTRMTAELMGSNDESHFNVVSLIVTDKVTRQRPQTTAF